MSIENKIYYYWYSVQTMNVLLKNENYRVQIVYIKNIPKIKQQCTDYVNDCCDDKIDKKKRKFSKHRFMSLVRGGNVVFLCNSHSAEEGSVNYLK
jgi:hypothetical protein